MTVWVGADWDRDKCVVASLVGEELRHWTVLRNPDSVRGWAEQFGGEIVVGIESGDAAWVALWRSAGADVYVFDGKKARRFSESLNSSGARDDRRSADDLLQMVQSQPHRERANPELSPDLKKLLMLLDSREDAVFDASRYSQRLMSLIRQVHPAFADVITTVDAAWVIRVLEAAPTPAAWHELSEDEQARALKGTSKSKRHHYILALGTSYDVIDPVVEEAVRTRIRIQIEQFKTARQMRSVADKALQEALAEDESASFLQSFDGVGPVLGCGAAIAIEHSKEHERGRDGAAVLLGVAPVTVRSGTQGDANPLVVMRRSSRNVLRKIGHLLGAQLIKQYRWARAQYAYYQSRGKSAFSSYRRVVRSFLRIAQALLRDGTSFDEERYLDSLRARGVEWAVDAG